MTEKSTDQSMAENSNPQFSLTETLTSSRHDVFVCYVPKRKSMYPMPIASPQILSYRQVGVLLHQAVFGLGASSRPHHDTTMLCLLPLFLAHFIFLNNPDRCHTIKCDTDNRNNAKLILKPCSANKASTTLTNKVGHIDVQIRLTQHHSYYAYFKAAIVTTL